MKDGPNNICRICRKAFYAWFHGQGPVCPECQKEEDHDEEMKSWARLARKARQRWMKEN